MIYTFRQAANIRTYDIFNVIYDNIPPHKTEDGTENIKVKRTIQKKREGDALGGMKT